jgi:hypothetical protein
MPYDPNLPLENTDIDAAEMRGQLQGLKELIDAVPTVDSAQVDGVNPLPPGSAPAASVAKVDSTLHFTFDLPVSIASVVVDSVTSVGPSDPVSVSATLIGEVLHLSFAISARIRWRGRHAGRGFERDVGGGDRGHGAQSYVRAAAESDGERSADDSGGAGDREPAG